MSELTGQPIPIVMRISLLIKSNHPDQSNPKYYIMHKGDGFSTKLHRKSVFHFKNVWPTMVWPAALRSSQFLNRSTSLINPILNGFLPGVVDGFGEEGTFVVPGSYTYSYKFSRVLS